MVSRIQQSTRTVQPADRAQLASLIHFETYVHRHLDWRSPLDWMDSHPFLVLQENEVITAALACPPDPPPVAWIRLFAAAGDFANQHCWDELWEAAYFQICKNEVVGWIAAIPQRTWFEDFLQRSGFSRCHRVVMLEWQSRSIESPAPLPGVKIRPMNWEDIPEVSIVDMNSFPPLWQNSQSALELAFRQAAFATVAQVDDQITGYQITTLTPVGAHLARLAVLPASQKQGIGSAILQDVQVFLRKRNVRVLTVNTQENNLASLALYHKWGFQLTGEAFQVYGISLLDRRQH